MKHLEHFNRLSSEEMTYIIGGNDPDVFVTGSWMEDNCKYAGYVAKESKINQVKESEKCSGYQGPHMPNVSCGHRVDQHRVCTNT